jgi:hypothetical protein
MLYHCYADCMRVGSRERKVNIQEEALSFLLSS